MAVSREGIAVNCPTVLVVLSIAIGLLLDCSDQPFNLEPPATRTPLLSYVGPTVQDAVRAGIAGTENIQFWRAIKDQSDNACFVLIHTIDGDTGGEDTYATEAAFLLGAIHLEHGLPYTESGNQAAETIALKTSGRVFRFKSAAALQNVPRYYSNAILEEMRAALKPYSSKELLAGFGAGGSLHSLYNRHAHPKGHAYEFAVAHVLLERGLIPRMHTQISAME